MLNYPSVAILVTTYNETFTVLEKTIVSSLAIDYPNFKIYILDDGKRGWLKDYCRHKQINYITRHDRKHAKAGNLNNALTKTQADFILVLDADIVPHKNILKKGLVPFINPKVAIVQMNQYFYNFDYIQNNLFAKKIIPDDQRYWCDIAQKYYNKKNLVMYCGSPALLRKKPLMECGGFPHETVTEDLNLSYRLYALGYIINFLDEKLALGLTAEDARSVCNQRHRWALGAMQMLHLKISPFRKNGLSLRQRCRLFFTIFAWFVYPLKIFMFFPPVVFYFTGVYVLYLPSVVTIVLLFLFFAVNIGFLIGSNKFAPIIHDSAFIIPVFHVAKAIFQGIFFRKEEVFIVTPKDLTRSSINFNYTLILPSCFLFSITALGIIYHTTHTIMWNTQELSLHLLNLLWGIYNILVLGTAILIGIDVPKNSDDKMWLIEEPASLINNQEKISCKIVAISFSKAIIDQILQQKVDNCYLILDNTLTLGIDHIIIENGKTGLFFGAVSIEQREKLIYYLFGEGRIQPTKKVKFSSLFNVMYYKIFKSWSNIKNPNKNLELVIE